MRDLYSVIDSTLSKVDFETIWKGFNKCEFALYNQETVYFKDTTIPWDNRFLGNTAIDFNGKVIAIWSVNSFETEDSDYLTADIVHEMFHAYQKQQGETRYPNDLELLAYPDNLNNYQTKMLENELLVKAFSEKSLKALKQFITLRKVRIHLIKDIIFQEFRAETLEGMAEYAGLAALEQINREKYITRIEDHLSKLLSSDELIFSPRRLAYFSGAVLCFVLKLLKINLHHELTEKQTLFEIITNNVDNFVIDFKGYMENKQNKLNGFLSSHSEIHTYDSCICGYDPMNMIRLDDKILCDHFVILDNKFIKGPVIVVLQEGSINKVKYYIK